MEELDESHAALGESTGQQAVVGVSALLADLWTVRLDRGLRLGGQIGDLGDRHLHAKRHLVLRDAGLNFRVARLPVLEAVELGQVIEP